MLLVFVTPFVVVVDDGMFDNVVEAIGWLGRSSHGGDDGLERQERKHQRSTGEDRVQY